MPSRTDPILITGSHRSGTTWVGKTLSEAPGVFYIHEPFNPLTRPGICRIPFERAYTYITHENGSQFEPALRDTLARRYSHRAELRALRTPRDLGRMIRDAARFAMSRFRDDRPLMKDPLALFASEWLAETFGMKVIVMIRHPAAFTSSLVNKSWWFDYRTFLDQPLLMRDHLSRYETAMRHQMENREDLIGQGILLWRLLHEFIRNLQETHPRWLFLRHEDLSREPLETFRSVFFRLDLPFTDSVRDGIARSTGAHNPDSGGSDTSVFDVKRDSRANIFSWKKRLSPEIIDRIREELADIWPQFYGEEDWGPEMPSPR